MPELEAISIDKEDVPYQFDIELEGEMFSFLIKYNALFDFFTVDLAKNGEALVYGVPMVYGVPLFGSLDDVNLPRVKLVPYDIANKEGAVTYDNMNKTVFLYVDGVPYA